MKAPLQGNELKLHFQKCLEAPERYASQQEKETCRKMVEALPEEDLIGYAANTSYAYWYLSRQSDGCPSEETKMAMAMREARRHLTYMSGDYDKAVANFIESTQYRKEKKVDLLRTCFYSDIEVREEDQARSKEMAETVLQDMTKQYCVIRGHDKHSRTVLIKFPRLSPGTTEEAYILSQMYMAERSIATTEFYSLGCEEQGIAIHDFKGSQSANAPPLQMQINATTLLQKLYPERLALLVLVEPPLWLRGALNLLAPFQSASIRESMKWASGLDAKEEIFNGLVLPENATPLMLQDGKLDTAVSLSHFLKDVPFYGTYDYVSCKRPIEPHEGEMHSISSALPAPSVSLASSMWNSIPSVSSYW